MDIYASDDEKAEEIKQWWRDNGLSVVAGVVLGIAILIGGRYWFSYQQNLAETAAEAYQQVRTSLASDKHDEAREQTQKILNDYASTPYAVFAAIDMASEDVRTGDESSAKTYLEWVLDHAKLSGQLDLARYRLAQLALNEQDYEQALKLAEQAQTDSFASLFAELKGDVFTAQGHKAEALAAYQSALIGAMDDQARQSLLSMKIDDVAVANES